MTLLATSLKIMNEKKASAFEIQFQNVFEILFGIEVDHTSCIYYIITNSFHLMHTEEVSNNKKNVLSVRNIAMVQFFCSLWEIL